tara:strand:- start:25 stop:240 length:216 start_codon:yes stop_codon:yes gene_type:complete
MKKLILIVIVSLSFQTNLYSSTDCSNLKKFSKEYLSCLAIKAKDKSNFVLDTSNIKEKKTISEWFKKKDEF